MYYQYISIGVITTKEELDRFANEFHSDELQVEIFSFDGEYAEIGITIFGTIKVDYYDTYLGRDYFSESEDFIDTKDTDTVENWLQPYDFEIDYIRIYDIESEGLYDI